MKINYANFIKSIADIKTYLAECDSYELPEICVAGRSNVGKSSLINMMCGQKKLAKTSQTPGRTRLLNLFDISGQFILVDLPGYGYAKAPKTEIEKWSKLTDGYFQNTTKLTHTLCLVDLRHEPSALDKHMVSYLYNQGQPFTIVATKADKLSKAQQSAHRQMLATSLLVGADNIIVTSASNGQGRDQLLARLSDILEVSSK